MVKEKINTNKPENTTMKLPKILRDQLNVIKYQCHLDEIHQVVQLLYNVIDLEQLEEISYSGINAGEQIKKEVVGIQSDALDN